MVKAFRKAAGIFVLAAMLMTTVAPHTVYAAENMVPTYEVKFLLDSDQVLNKDQRLKKEYRNYFETSSDYLTMGILYLDTETQDFNSQGWINRIDQESSKFRAKKAEPEVTFKP